MRMGTPYQEDHPNLLALYTEAKASQWTMDELPWDQLDVPEDANERASASVAAGVLAALSNALLRVTSRGVNTAPETVLPLVLSVEGRDYARHLEFWRRILEQFGPTAPLAEGWQEVERTLALEGDDADVVTLMLCGVQPVLRALYTCADESETTPFWQAAYRFLRADLDRHIAIATEAAALHTAGCEDDVKRAFTTARALLVELRLPDVGPLQGMAVPFHSAVSVMSALLLHLS